MYSTSITDEANKLKTNSRLPTPAGYKVLIAIPKLEEKTSGGIYRPESLMNQEETASIVGYVLALGSAAYEDKTRFPKGALCAEGDWVIFRPYSGTRFTIDGMEFRLINDDTVEAVTDDPRGYKRA